MDFFAMSAVFIGAGFGAVLRGLLGVALNPILPTMPLGTLAANLLGGYLIGIAMGYFTFNANLPPEVRLFAVTGFLGGLTTFSTFSAEVVTLFMQDQWGWALAAAGMHLIGSLTMTMLGILTLRSVLPIS